MIADYHVHTEFSDDSTEPMENIIHKAIDMNIAEICFTDHVDYGIKADHDEKPKEGQLFNVDYPEYFKKIAELKKTYQGRIAIKAGLEFGMQTHTIEKFKKIFDTYDLDFVILSCHQVRDKEFYSFDFQKGKTPDEYNAEYYQEIYNCVCQYKNYSVIGHLDMIQRYNDSLYPFEKSKEIISKILARTIADDKGIEVNTSSFRYGLKDLTPSREILKLYYELGGKTITIGSDCHKAEDIGDHIPYVKQELRKIGFAHFCTFDKMQPFFHDL